MVFKILHIITSTTTADMYVTRLINYYNSVFRILNWDDIPYYSFLSFFYQLYNYFSGKSIIISRAHVLNSFIHPASGQKNFKQEVKKNINNNNFLLLIYYKTLTSFIYNKILIIYHISRINNTSISTETNCN
ncbi:predicted protein [Candida tropicalis MYA-3404]|uniref:Uncharacterized protein n=1 Tax=Candida tropicalis (strain ATCC MYA-3404 / T1) TaxID=294747 RepID=C5MFN1_CANTT|nr:predicted protein [Candida tropicalis MYA-3404]EER31144.1 predicted protein [Candida tropicalis MYA-3404]KAG4404707.1 hypothetical protein JTP64_005721 [Candida tropicalis]